MPAPDRARGRRVQVRGGEPGQLAAPAGARACEPAAPVTAHIRYGPAGLRRTSGAICRAACGGASRKSSRPLAMPTPPPTTAVNPSRIGAGTSGRVRSVSGVRPYTQMTRCPRPRRAAGSGGGSAIRCRPRRPGRRPPRATRRRTGPGRCQVLVESGTGAAERDHVVQPGGEDLPQRLAVRRRRRWRRFGRGRDLEAAQHPHALVITVTAVPGRPLVATPRAYSSGGRQVRCAGPRRGIRYPCRGVHRGVPLVHGDLKSARSRPCARQSPPMPAPRSRPSPGTPRRPAGSSPRATGGRPAPSACRRRRCRQARPGG